MRAFLWVIQMTTTTMRLSGELGRMYGRVHRFHLDSKTPQEGIAALLANYPKLAAYFMQAKDRGIAFHVFRGKRSLKQDELESDSTDGDIRIAPVIIGSKSGGLFNIILGAALVAVGIYGNLTGGWGTPFIQAGIGLIAGGVVQLLTPAPKGLNKNEAAANTPNDSFSGAVNTQAAGNPVPVLLGRMIVGSAVGSAGIQAEDVIASQPPTSASGGGMGGGGNSIALKAQ